MATEQTAHDAADQMTIRLRGKKLVIDLDDRTHQTLTDLATLTGLDVNVIISITLARGLKETAAAAQDYQNTVSGAKTQFMSVAPLPGTPPAETPAAANQAQKTPTSNATDASGSQDPPNDADPTPTSC